MYDMHLENRIIPVKMLVVWLVLFLSCHATTTIGYVKPENISKRTMIDISKEDSSTLPSNVVRHARKTAKKRTYPTKDLRKPSDVEKDGSLMETWMQNNLPGESKAAYTVSPVKSVMGKKKQYSTDDFRVNSMVNEPMMTPDAPPPIMAPVPNHVQIDDFDEGVHMGPPPEEEHEEPHLLPHIEEPTYVHHVEPPPPPPPPEPVMIPVPIAAPPPPPPPPPPCTVQIPVTIHLKGKLAIKMKHCENCDFSKNIEAIGPLKIAPLNGLKGKLTGAVEAQAKQTILDSATLTEDLKSKDLADSPAVKKSPPIQRPMADINDVLSKSDFINLDDNFFVTDELLNNVVATKKDVTLSEGEKRQVIVTKQVVVPTSLVPSNAYKRGVIISLPKGKALLKCIAPINDTETKQEEPSGLSSSESSSESETTPKHVTPQSVAPVEGSYPAMNNAVVTFSSLENQSRIIKPTSMLTSSSSSSQSITPDSVNIKDSPVTENTDEHENKHENGHKSHKLTEKFLRMFDKDMLVSLYKMAVKDILNELRRQKKAHRKSQVMKGRLKSLKNEQAVLENQFPGISKILADAVPHSFEALVRRVRSEADVDNSGDIDDADDEHSVTFNSVHGSSVTVIPQKSHTLNGTRRVKLVDTYRVVKPSPKMSDNSTKHKKQKKLVKPTFSAVHKNSSQNKEFVPEEASSALSFYGDLDPTKLMDDSPTCIDAMCEKHKQFIKHAGQYFQSLDSIALEPYKAFMNDKVKNTSPSMDGDSSVIELPYGDTMDMNGMRRNVLPKKKSTKRQSIVNGDDEAHSGTVTDEPNTVVELFGKLPRVPLKITLNPKGPLAKMKKPIEIDLRPPGKGEPSSKMIATASDPSVAVHIANKIFKEEPLDAKQERKLQSVYADIKRSKIDDDKQIKHIYLQARKVITKNASPRMKIIVSLPKELTKLVSQGNYQSLSRSTTSFSKPTVASYAGELAHDTPLRTQKPTYVVGQENENKVMGVEKEKLRPEIEEYEQKLRKLKEQTNAVLAEYNKYKDPYADIGKKRRIKNKNMKHVKKIKADPYADMGSNVNLDKRSKTTTTTVLRKTNLALKAKNIYSTKRENVKTAPFTDLKSQQNETSTDNGVIEKKTPDESKNISMDNETESFNKNSTEAGDKDKKEVKDAFKIQTAPSVKDQTKLSNVNKTEYEILAQDPYATLGSSISSLNKRETLPRRKKRLDKRHHKPRHQSRLDDVKSSKRHYQQLQTKQDIPSQTAISLIRHNPKDEDISKEVTVEPSAPVKAPINTNTDMPKIQDNPQVKLDADKPLGDDVKSSMMAAFPKFSEALSKINPEMRKKLLNLKPFKFLSNIDTSGIAYKPNGKDPYADLGSDAQTSKRKVVAKTSTKKHHLRSVKMNSKTEKARKRSETYDPYADLGTSIGLSQNEARANENSGTNNDTQTVRVSLTNDKDENQNTHDETLKGGESSTSKKPSKSLSPSVRTQDENISKFIGASTSHISAFETEDPYADLGASTNRGDSKLSKTTANKTINAVNQNQTTLAGHKTAKLTNQDEIEHFIGKLKLPEKIKSTANEMETGDLIDQNEVSEQLPSKEKEVSGENELATIERLENEIASEKEKADASEFPPSSLLKQNVGKEIEGPYTDMGNKKKKIEMYKHPRKVSDQVGVKKSKAYHHVVAENLRKRDRTESKLKRLAKALYLLKHSYQKRCGPLKPEQIAKLMKHTGEYIGVNNPYTHIGKEVEQIAKKYHIDPCKIPVIKEDELPLGDNNNLHLTKQDSQKEKSSNDPYAEMGTSVQAAEKKKTIGSNPDPYADLGTVSTRNRIETMQIDSKLRKANILRNNDPVEQESFPKFQLKDTT